MRDVLRKAGFSHAMIRAYRDASPQARTEWDSAREESADALFDEAMAIARNKGAPWLDKDGKPVLDKHDRPIIIAPDAALARTHVDTLKWAARIRNPRLYGDKAQLDVNVRTIDLTRIIEAANARLASARVIEAEVLAPKLENLL